LASLYFDFGPCILAPLFFGLFVFGQLTAALNLICFGHDFPPDSSCVHAPRGEPSPSADRYNQPPNLQETAMREFVRPLAALSTITCLVTAMALVSTGGALAQVKQAPPNQMAPAQAAPPAQAPALKQMALTDKQVEGVLAASKDMDAVTSKLPENGKPDPKITAQLDGVAKKNGFASYDEYNNVVDNISMVLAGFDPATKKYVGTEAVIKAQIAQIQADKKMPAKDKKEALAEFDNALKSPPPPVANKGNIDLVAKYYDKLAALMGDDQE
jgi:hypothetical protein